MVPQDNSESSDVALDADAMQQPSVKSTEVSQVASNAIAAFPYVSRLVDTGAVLEARAVFPRTDN